MAFVTVQDPTQPASSPITGIFYSPQNDPAPSGYIGWIDDSDSRIATYLTPTPSPTPTPTPGA